MTIIAKYAATCTTCQAPITPGQQIEWAKGAPVMHTRCAAGVASGRLAAPAAVASRPSSARLGSYRTIGARQQARQRATGWTGCRCGSIEDRPRDSDCASCQHDA